MEEIESVKVPEKKVADVPAEKLAAVVEEIIELKSSDIEAKLKILEEERKLKLENDDEKVEKFDWNSIGVNEEDEAVA